jgi:hypothetical protein
MCLHPTIGRRIRRGAKGIVTILPQSSSSLIMELNIYDPEVKGIEISSGVDGVENAGWMDGCFIGGWHIRLIS